MDFIFAKSLKFYEQNNFLIKNRLKAKKYKKFGNIINNYYFYFLTLKKH